MILVPRADSVRNSNLRSIPGRKVQSDAGIWPGGEVTCRSGKEATACVKSGAGNLWTVGLSSNGARDGLRAAPPGGGRH
eukprot:151400-Hanusia_phi.AAC.1